MGYGLIALGFASLQIIGDFEDSLLYTLDRDQIHIFADLIFKAKAYNYMLFCNWICNASSIW